MLKLQGENVAFNCQMSKIILSITLIMLNGYHPMALTFLEGQIANLEFPYPCDSTQVTIQHRNKAPFYRLTDVSAFSLSQDQAHRFNVKNIQTIYGCLLKLTIRNLVRNDEGTYISSVYKNGTLLHDDTHRIWLRIDYPPGKATCVEGENKGGKWMAMECTASIGSVPGKIECYQNGLWMFPLTDPLESDTTLKQTILILATQPVFCCSSALEGQKDRCECNDTAFYQDGGRRKDPCPPTSTITPGTPIFNITDSVTITQSPQSHPLIHMARESYFRAMLDSHFEPLAIIILVVMAVILITMFILIAILFHKLRKEKANGNKRKSESKKQMNGIPQGACLIDASTCTSSV